MCTICLPSCHVYVEVGVKLVTSQCLLPVFPNFVCVCVCVCMRVWDTHTHITFLGCFM